MNKVKALEDLEGIVNGLKRDKKKIVWTNGTFDIVHIGHIKLFKQAKALGDVLIVGMNSDISVKKNKGEDRPYFPQEDRAEFLSELECVDYVILYDEAEPLYLLKVLQPDVKVKGGSYIKERVEKEDRIVRNYGGESVYFPTYKNYSSTSVLNNKH